MASASFTLAPMRGFLAQSRLRQQIRKLVTQVAGPALPMDCGKRFIHKLATAAVPPGWGRPLCKLMHNCETDISIRVPRVGSTS